MKAAAISCLLLATLPAAAQVPGTLLHTITPPPGGVQSDARAGYSVAIRGLYTLVGALMDDTGASNAGVVKVYNSVTGGLIMTLPNPSPAAYDQFGISVAFAGNYAVVGCPIDDTGATDTGIVYVFNLDGATPTVPVYTLTNPSPGTNDQFGFVVAADGNRIAVGSPLNDTPAPNNAVAGDAGSVYVYDLGSPTPNAPVFTIHNPIPNTNEQFGVSVGVSGTRVVVGAHLDSALGTHSGSAYVYDLSGPNPTVPIASLDDPGPHGNDFFGRAVAILGTTVAVGAYGSDPPTSDAGGAYVYDLNSPTPTLPVLTLENPVPVGSGGFGISVALSSNSLLVGAYTYDHGAATDAGRAYLYNLASGTPTVPVLILNNPSPAASDLFGWSVTMSGSDLVIGAPADNAGATNAGSAYIYDINTATPTVPKLTLNHPGPAISGRMGISLAVSGSLMVVGSDLDDTGAGDSGRAHVYNLGSGTPTVPTLTLNNPSPAFEDYFGFSVAASGTRIVVGSHSDDTGLSNAGSVYVFDTNSGTPSVPVVTINNPSPYFDDFFGYSVAVSGNRLAVGTPLEDTGDGDTGTVFVYDLGSATPSVPVWTVNNPAPAPLDQFGVSVALSGVRVVVGANLDDAGATNTGRAYVYDLSGGTPTTPVLTLSNPTPAADDDFGWTVAISGTRIVVGAPGDNTGAANAGSAYVYDLGSATPGTPVVILNNPDPDVDDAFANSVSISGTIVVVGCRQDDAGGSNSGSVYVYDLSSATPTVPAATLPNPNPAVEDRFGRAVSIDGPTLAVGAPLRDGSSADNGGAYVFTTNPLDLDNDGLRDAWETAHFGTSTGHGPLDDTDHDGYSELLELAFGLNPSVPDPGGLPGAVDEGGYLTMIFTRQPGAAYEVQSAGILLPGQPGSFSGASTVDLSVNDVTIKVRDTVPIGSTPSRFMRVKVTAAP